MALTVHNMSVKAGKDLKITGVPQINAEGFTINLGQGDENIALHFNVRFNQHGDRRTVVFNSKHAGSWSSEQREKSFPFKEGEEFKVRPCMFVSPRSIPPCFKFLLLHVFRRTQLIFLPQLQGSERVQWVDRGGVQYVTNNMYVWGWALGVPEPTLFNLCMRFKGT
uniref:Galectin n=1 Tax=Paramormyrops kingsleyae TaxID=1676925 RepID=A0A3B3QZP3_9TELE